MEFPAYDPDDPLAFTIEYAPGATPSDLGFYFITCRQCAAEFIERERADGWRPGLKQKVHVETDRSCIQRPHATGKRSLTLRYEPVVMAVWFGCSCGCGQLIGLERLGDLPALGRAGYGQCEWCGTRPLQGFLCNECVLIDAHFGPILSLDPLPDFLKLS